VAPLWAREKGGRDIRNLWIKTPSGIVKNPMRPLVDLDRLPFIEFDLFEPERKWLVSKNIDHFQRSVDIPSEQIY
jgi:hypothetical protein